jgi:hypothetical protein
MMIKLNSRRKRMLPPFRNILKRVNHSQRNCISIEIKWAKVMEI